jgi:hypothetical protein
MDAKKYTSSLSISTSSSSCLAPAIKSKSIKVSPLRDFSTNCIYTSPFDVHGSTGDVCRSPFVTPLTQRPHYYEWFVYNIQNPTYKRREPPEVDARIKVQKRSIRSHSRRVPIEFTPHSKNMAWPLQLLGAEMPSCRCRREQQPHFRAPNPASFLSADGEEERGQKEEDDGGGDG